MKKKFKRILSLLLCLSLLFIPMPKYNVAAVEFSDISSHWAYELIQRYANNDVINVGEDNAFKPDAAITRAEFVKMMINVMGLIRGDSASFSDVKREDWYFIYVAGAVQMGLISGYGDGTFRPDNLITREEAAKVLSSFLDQYEYYDEAPARTEDIAIFSDAGEISVWAKPYVESLFKKVILIGTPENKIKPQSNITRAEALKMLDTGEDYYRRYLVIWEGEESPYKDMDMDADEDGDGLSNYDEIYVYYTNESDADTDGDGLSDYDEIFIYFTDPRNFDTDGDSIYDGAEIALGLDPFTKDDPTTRFDFELVIDGMKMKLTGHGNLYYAEVRVNNTIRGNNKVYSDCFELKLWQGGYQYPFDVAVEIQYDKESPTESLQLYEMHPRTKEIVQANSLNINADTGTASGVFVGMPFDSVYSTEFWFFAADKGMGSADTYNVLYSFDLSGGMDKFDPTGDYFWMEPFVNLLEQLNDNTDIGVMEYPDQGFANPAFSQNKQAIKDRLENINTQFSGRSDIIEQLDLGGKAFEQVKDAYQNFVVGTMVGFNINPDVLKNKLNELSKNNTTVCLIVFEDDLDKMSNVTKLSDSVNGILIPCSSTGDLKILMGEIYAEFAKLKSTTSQQMDSQVNRKKHRTIIG